MSKQALLCVGFLIVQITFIDTIQILTSQIARNLFGMMLSFYHKETLFFKYELFLTLIFIFLITWFSKRSSFHFFQVTIYLFILNIEHKTT